jgi:hypothetical protein
MTDPTFPVEPGITAEEFAAAVGEHADVSPLATTLTPKLKLPYPAPSDPVANGAINFRDLALAVDNAGLFGPVAYIDVATAWRNPAYEGELGLLVYSPAVHRCQDWTYHLMRGGGTSWYSIGPNTLSISDPTAWAVPAGSQNDPTCHLENLPYFYGSLFGSYQAAGVLDCVLSDSAGHATYFTQPGSNPNLNGVWGQQFGNLFLQFFNGGGTPSVQYRAFGVRISRTA